MHRAQLSSFGVPADLAAQPMYTLSGGQKSRVAMVRWDAWPRAYSRDVAARAGLPVVFALLLCRLLLQPLVLVLPAPSPAAAAQARVTFSKPHLLLLDEPSNHLDMDAVEALVEVGAVATYVVGCMVTSLIKLC